MEIFKLKYLAVIFFILLSGTFSFASEEAAIILNPSVEKVEIGKSVFYLKDSAKNWKIEDILSPSLQQLFIKSKSDVLAFGFSSSAYWVKFDVENRTDIAFKGFIELAYPHYDNIEFYELDENKKIVKKVVTGDHKSFKEREVDYRNFAFKVNQFPHSKSTFFIRIESQGPLNFHLLLWQEKNFYSNVSIEQILLGIYFGGIIAILLYNFFLSLSLKNSTYFFYIIYYISFLSFSLILNGLGYQYFWPNSVAWQNHSIPFFILLSIVLAIQFSRSYLNLSEKTPDFDSVFVFVIMFTMILIPFSFLINYSLAIKMAVIIAVLCAILISFALIKVLLMGYRPARFYAYAWTFFWVGTIVSALRSFAFIPNNIGTRWGQQFASLFEVFIISFGFADQINFMKKNYEELNEDLEKKVGERTNELNGALEILESQKEEIELELNLAADIQAGILPEMPYHHEGIKIEAFYKAMGKVGGDFYDIFKMPGGYLGIMIADASGHGMPAAFITAMAKISFSEAIQSFLFPADIFRAVNNELIKTIQTDDFVTSFFMIVSPSFDVLYGNASHQKALVLRSKDWAIDEWDTDGLFLGALSEANDMYENGSDFLNFGDRIILYTDGITEAKNEYDEFFGEDRLKKMFHDTAELPIDEARVRIMSQWSDYTEGIEPTDDVTLLIIEIDPVYSKLIDYRDEGFKLLSENRLAEAIDVLLKALAIDSKDEKVHLYIGECYLKQEEYGLACEHLEFYLENNEVDANVWYHLALATFHLRNYSTANEYSQKACQLRGDYIDSIILSAKSKEKLFMFHDAISSWKQVLKIEPENQRAKMEIRRLNESK